jgi:hypothetical protein
VETNKGDFMNEAVLTKHLEILGFRVRDKVTGFVGVATSVVFDLYGCVQAAVTPPGVDKDGKTFMGHWFDTTRLVITDVRRVMPIPDYTPKTVDENKDDNLLTGTGTASPEGIINRPTLGTPGPAEKPSMER